MGKWAKIEGTRGQGDTVTRGKAETQKHKQNSRGDMWARGHGTRAEHARGHVGKGTWGQGEPVWGTC